MTKPITSDNFPTPPVAKERKLDAQTPEQGSPTGTGATAGTADSADVTRGQQLLTREMAQSRDTALTSSAQARERIAQLKAQITADPQTASRAHGKMQTDFFEAAIARPAA